MTNIIELSAHLRDELARNSKPQPVDPRSVPLRFSTMKRVAESPLHYWFSVQHEIEETLSMRLGSGCHAMLFDTPYRVWHGRRAGDKWEKFAAEHAGETILNQTEYERALDMATAIRQHQTASRLLFTDTVVEKRIDWEWQGRAFRSTPDAASRTHIVDLKCLRSADPEKVLWQSRNMFYNAQAALYRRALNSIGHNIKDCYLVVVENKAPYPVTVFRFTETALEAGDRSLVDWMGRVRQCEEANNYPGYATTIQDLGVPMAMDDLQFEEDESDGDE